MNKIRTYISAFAAIIIAASLCCNFDADAAVKKATGKGKAATTATKKNNSKAGNNKNSKNNTAASRQRSKGKNTAPAKKATKKSTTKSQSAPKKPTDPVLSDSLTLAVNAGILDWIPNQLNPGGLRVNSVKTDAGSRTARVSLNENFTYLPVNKELINDLSKQVAYHLPDSVSDYQIRLVVNGDKPLSYYITTIDKLPESARNNPPFVVEAEPLSKAKNGMEGDIVAMWASHGRYFKPGSGNWYWQRPQLFQVCEDTYTMGYIYPYVVPMIENAGGYVLLPRERNINKNEVIVDNDTNEGGEIFSQPYYKEKTGSQKWTVGDGEGFIYDLERFRDTENPFENGTYRQTKTITSGKESLAAWYADIPEDGEYAVYVSYKTLPNSTGDARYTVNYSGGSKEFRVNQTMSGGTWVYLGTFPLEAGYSDTEPIVTLSNMSSKAGKILTADAVKIGGGMGNIERSDRRTDLLVDPSTPEETDLEYISGLSFDDEDDAEALDEFNEQLEAAKEASKSGYTPQFITSGLPRWLEGARYWLHWAGFPEYIYSPFHGKDDYKDDYSTRGKWVNYLAGGSRVLPGREGLNIPIDVSMALHSDAGKRDNDTFIGTLGIYYTRDGAYYADGTPRTISRALTDMLMRQITMDIRQTWEPNWTRRSMWDKQYAEANTPEVPASLIEFMSHQNYADMKYGLDPNFKFTVGRSIYKSIGRFIAERKDRKFIVQPLPVKDFYISRTKKGEYKLSWQPTEDPLEPTATPDRYIIMERSGDDLGFHKLGETSSRSFTVKVNDNDIHSFQIIAANDGGRSFPSETLALKEGGDKPVLIVNGFTRIAAPMSASSGNEAGFYSTTDFGVPYIKDISFIGYQNEFRRSAGDRFGQSDGNYASTVIAGNTFDYAYVHGNAIAQSGKGFVSASASAVENGDVNLNNYPIVDLILGKQKSTVVGFGHSGIMYTAFPKELQDKIRSYVKAGGDLLVTGTYVASDLFDDRSPSGSSDFARNILGISLNSGERPHSGKVSISGNNFKSKRLDYNNTLNEKCYIVENPDILSPVGNNSNIFMEYSDTGEAAGIINRNGKGTVIVSAIPFETINPEQRSQLMNDYLNELSR